MSARRPEDFAIVVGINRYPELGGLVAAEQDAIRFAEWLLREEGGGLDPDHVRSILSSQFREPASAEDAQPIQNDIDKELRRFIKEFLAGRTERVGARLYFYFAGHGMGPDVENVALLMADAATAVLNSNLGYEAYKKYLVSAAPFDELIFILDCCRDFSKGVELRGPPFTGTTNVRRAPNVRYFAALATQFGRKAFEEIPSSSQHKGLLTTALLEGLERGPPGGGPITAAWLKTYLDQRVPELAAGGPAQRPLVLCPHDDLTFGAPRPPSPAPGQLARVRVTPPTGVSGDLQLSGNNFELLQLAAAAAPWEVDLAAGLYKALLVPGGASVLFEVPAGGSAIDVQFGR